MLALMAPTDIHCWLMTGDPALGNGSPALTLLAVSPAIAEVIC